jgi:guanine nucleotide-binding protein G(i) subunit alpha
MNEAAGLFESISNSRCVPSLHTPPLTHHSHCESSRWFSDSSVILFMNKTDLFRAKLISSPIYEYYSDYEGPSDYATGSAYMEGKFTPLYRGEGLRVHFTCATDTEQLKIVFGAVEDNIMQASLARSVSDIYTVCDWD